MFNKNIKLVIAALIIAYAVYQFIEGYVGNGIALILLSLVFIFLYFRNELILLAFLRMRKQDMEGTQRWLEKIKNPEIGIDQKTTRILQLPSRNHLFSKEPYPS